MKSLIVNRSVVIAGHKTSVSPEDSFWNALKQIALSRGITLSELVAAIESARPSGNLSSAIRLFVLGHYRNRIETPDARVATEEPGRESSSKGPPGGGTAA